MRGRRGVARTAGSSNGEVTSRVGVWDWAIREDRLSADEVVAELFGLDPEEMGAGIPFERWMHMVHPDDRGQMRVHLARTRGPFRSEYRTCSRDGSSRRVQVQGRFYRDAQGRPVRSSGTVLDITQRPGDPGRALDEAADHCMAARLAVARIDAPLVRRLLDMTLIEIGRALAQQEERRH
ncbi:PAS domain-containing protein [Methylobacterium oryzisoli]|uniref:PAS domain-containing protein n=1 Tax=Methylobacterium oryzisoli TaxID=3385502 RepID=UPI003892B94F